MTGQEPHASPGRSSRADVGPSAAPGPSDAGDDADDADDADDDADREHAAGDTTGGTDAGMSEPGRDGTGPGTGEASGAPRQCRFPGCTRPARRANPGGGRPPSYCSDPSHNKASRFKLMHGDAAPHGAVAGQQTPPQLAASRGTASPHGAVGAATPPPDDRSAGGGGGEALVAALRRAECAEALADDRQQRLVDAETRAERREAQYVDRLMAASEEIATLRAQLDDARRGA